ncbi:MAG: hypothetical protein BJBARM4_0666 [Candidatus Parvarchaeum acidiphilum ARMAN-4]|jgi:hypothetical protein|uniref:Uncharacterized protein n=1 Tax=Candidatus Parvarchaeum acidiphilum ARMAN-4 TaxID=662760 RepID=D2EFY5_PARA4|nr:MAG: hypothetical protein BJBARM4_0666 [Candidatus Parvarchaeum acidiphilum ARMAN-4]
MISNKKAQGLPINTIILIAIGLLILVLLVTFVLGGFKGLGGGASTSSSAISAFEAQCQTTASSAASSGSFPYGWCSSTMTESNGKVLWCYTNPSSLDNTTTVTLYNGSTLGAPNNANADVKCP